MLILLISMLIIFLLGEVIMEFCTLSDIYTVYVFIVTKSNNYKRSDSSLVFR